MSAELDELLAQLTPHQRAFAEAFGRGERVYWQSSRKGGRFILAKPAEMAWKEKQMVNRMQAQVQEFHEAFGAPVGTTPALIADDRAQLRINLMLEELSGEGELVESIIAGDLVGIADGIMDLLYVTIGTAVEYGINIQPIFDEVQDSNMSKLGADGKPIYREDGKILKGPGFFQPAIAMKLEAQGWVAPTVQF